MSFSDDEIKRFGQRQQNFYRTRYQPGRSGTGDCSFCGRQGVRLEQHHFSRAACSDEVVLACRDCHDFFRNCERFEHPPLPKSDTAAAEENARRLFGLSDILELVVIMMRRLANQELQSLRNSEGSKQSGDFKDD